MGFAGTGCGRCNRAFFPSAQGGVGYCFPCANCVICATGSSVDWASITGEYFKYCCDSF